MNKCYICLCHKLIQYMSLYYLSIYDISLWPIRNGGQLLTCRYLCHFTTFFLKLSPSLTQSSNHFYSFSFLQCSGHVLCVDNSTFSLLVYRMTTLGSAGLLCIMFQFCKSGMVHSLTIFLPHCNALEPVQRCYLCSWLYFSRSSKLQPQKKKVKLTKT